MKTTKQERNIAMETTTFSTISQMRQSLFFLEDNITSILTYFYII